MFVVVGTVGTAVATGAAAIGSAVVTGLSAVGSTAAGIAGGIGGSIGAVGSSIGKGISMLGSSAPGWLKSAGSSVKNLYSSVKGGFGLTEKLNNIVSGSEKLTALKGSISAAKDSNIYKTAKNLYGTYNKVKEGIGVVNSLLGGPGGIARAMSEQNVQGNYQSMIETQIRANQYNATLLNNRAAENWDIDAYNRDLGKKALREQMSVQDLMQSASGARMDKGTPLINKIDNYQSGLLGLNIEYMNAVNNLNKSEDLAYLAYVQGNAEVERLIYEAKTSRSKSLQPAAKAAGGTVQSWIDKGEDWLVDKGKEWLGLSSPIGEPNTSIAHEPKVGGN